jgi:hypothetical protein
VQAARLPCVFAPALVAASLPASLWQQIRIADTLRARYALSEARIVGADLTSFGNQQYATYADQAEAENGCESAADYMARQLH